MRSKFTFNTLVMIYAVVVAVALGTWLLPGGEYQRVEHDGRTLVIAGSFQPGATVPQGPGKVLLAPIKGFIKSADILVFLFVIGGAFMVIEKTGALASGLKRLAGFFAKRPHLHIFFIPITVTIFSIAGSVFGMCEETMPFVLIFIPLAMALGYDSLVGTAIPFLGAAAGFAGSTLNPFIVGIAQRIAEIPPRSGLEYRLLVWVISTACMAGFIMLYAARIRKDPTKSPVYELDKLRKHDLHLDADKADPFLWKHKLVLLVFGLSIVALVFGVMKYEWFITEIAALFFALAIAAGLLGRLSMDELTDAFKEGARGMMGVALIIACAKATLVVATDGKILDSMLYGMATVISRLHPIVAAQSMFVAQGVLNFFVHSGSGQAALTMPVMAPLADVIGLTRQTAVLAFQFGEGWINPVLPTSGVTMGVLGLAGIPWNTWVRWMLPAQIFFFILALVLLIPPVLLHWQ
ncbi:MAG: Na+/H+ antiporter NhaC family protein [Elusimicrobiota bacterium]